MSVRTIDHASSEEEVALFLAQSRHVPINPRLLLDARDEHEVRQAVAPFDFRGEKTFAQLWAELNRYDVKLLYYPDEDVISLFRMRSVVLISTKDGWQLRETGRTYPHCGFVPNIKEWSVSETINRTQAVPQVEYFKHSQEGVNEDPVTAAVRGLWQELDLDVSFTELTRWHPSCERIDPRPSSVYAGTMSEGFLFRFELVLPERPWIRAHTVEDGGTVVHMDWMPMAA